MDVGRGGVEHKWEEGAGGGYHQDALYACMKFSKKKSLFLCFVHLAQSRTSGLGAHTQTCLNDCRIPLLLLSEDGGFHPKEMISWLGQPQLKITKLSSKHLADRTN